MVYLSDETVLNDVRGMFENYYHQFVPQLYGKIDNICGKQEVFKDKDSRYSCIAKLTRGVIKQLASVSTFSLLDFFQNNELSYFEFNEQLLEREFIESFHTKYPLVPFKINATITNYIDRFEEIFSLITSFEQEICSFNNTSVGKKMMLSDIEAFDGDFHKDTFVVILTIEGAKVVLKKRPNLGEQCLNIFSKYFKSESISIPVIRTKILSDTLCLQEFIEPHQNWKTKEISDYYYKFGIMTAIFTILGTKDLHSENVIATQKGPYFIDLEAAITSKLQTMSYSLLKETYIFNSNEERIVYNNIDLSAFTGDDLYLSDIEIINHGKDNICLNLVPKKIVRHNIPNDNLNNKINPIEYSFEVLSGYHEGIRVFRKFQNQIISDLKEIENYEYRLVLRNTGFYAKYLKDLSLPTYTKSFQKTKNYLDLLNKVSKRTPDITQEEIVCLGKNIVPYFTTNLFFDSESIKSEFINRLMGFDDEVANREEYYLKLILNISEDESINLKSSTTKDRIIFEVNRFLNFCSNELGFCYGTVDLSINNRLMNYRNDIFTFGASLVFLNYFSKSNSLYKKIEYTIKNSRSRHHISGLTGYHSELLLKHLLGIEMDYNYYVSVNELMHAEDVVDFSTYGTAIIVLDILYRNSLFDKFLIDLKILGEKYLRNLNSQKLTGLFHGYAGDCFVLNILYKYMDKQVITKVLYQSLIKENKLYLKGNWLDSRDTQNRSKKSLFALSYGTPGILLSRLSLLNNTDLPDNIKKIALEDIELGVEAILRKRQSEYLDDTLINGFAGSILTLKLIKNSKCLSLKKELSEQVSEYLITAEVALATGDWNYQSSDKRNLSFFNGRLGTAFVLLLLSNEDLELDTMDKIFGV
ncbi:TPA: DUF4135 domain-containing protein [Streptococcus suis]|uniref:DUF4135 domain-containing protein n=1 Tax=Streptococcus suis TaxID=1307 RepID=UPI000409B692|nr:DUF4135 domain-containing protein [Streptococcus suis]HEL1701858.1 DUF4135 domain-containing protein [Streptococcus suis]